MLEVLVQWSFLHVTVEKQGHFTILILGGPLAVYRVIQVPVYQASKSKFDQKQHSNLDPICSDQLGQIVTQIAIFDRPVNYCTN